MSRCALHVHLHAMGPVLVFSRGVNHPTYPSVLQSLEIEDPVVANCLIDQRGIERILLIKVTCPSQTSVNSYCRQGNLFRVCCIFFVLEFS